MKKFEYGIELSLLTILEEILIYIWERWGGLSIDGQLFKIWTQSRDARHTPAYRQAGLVGMRAGRKDGRGLGKRF